MANNIMSKIYKRDRIILGGVGGFLVACIVTALLVIVNTDISRIESSLLISFSLDVISILFGTVLYFASIRVLEHENRQGFVLSFLLSTNVFIIFLHLIYVLLAGKPQCSGLLMLLYSLIYIFGRALNLTGLGYVYLVTKPAGRFETKLLNFGVLISIIDIWEMLFNHFFKFYFYINESGYYQRNEALYPVCYIGPFIVLMIDVVLILKTTAEKNFSRCIAIFVGISTAATVLQLLIPYMNVNYIGTFFAILLLYCTVQDVEYKRRVNMAAQMDRKISEQKMLLLQSQMQPHFLYNSMVSIRRLINKDQNAAVAAMDNFIAYLRGNVDLLGFEGMIPVKQELDFIENYLELQKVRFGEKIDYEFIINEDNFKILPLTVQPLVENSIRHGIRKRMDGAGKVVIETGVADEEYWIEVKDNGVGFNTDKPFFNENDGKTHVGLNNAKLRIEAIGGRVVVHSKEDKGTTIRIYLPMGVTNENFGN